MTITVNPNKILTKITVKTYRNYTQSMNNINNFGE